jgi:hypothetical protein
MSPIDLSNLSVLSQNLSATVQDGKLILVIDLSKTIGLSSSGKMVGIASTGGFQAVPGTPAKINLYVGKKA